MTEFENWETGHAAATTMSSDFCPALTHPTKANETSSAEELQTCAGNHSLVESTIAQSSRERAALVCYKRECAFDLALITTVQYRPPFIFI